MRYLILLTLFLCVSTLASGQRQLSFSQGYSLPVGNETDVLNPGIHTSIKYQPNISNGLGFYIKAGYYRLPFPANFLLTRGNTLYFTHNISLFMGGHIKVINSKNHYLSAYLGSSSWYYDDKKNNWDNLNGVIGYDGGLSPVEIGLQYQHKTNDNWGVGFNLNYTYGYYHIPNNFKIRRTISLLNVMVGVTYRFEKKKDSEDD